jgi:hypothetical protein
MWQWGKRPSLILSKYVTLACGHYENLTNLTLFACLICRLFIKCTGYTSSRIYINIGMVSACNENIVVYLVIIS